jgi:hypothetical protein
MSKHPHWGHTKTGLPVHKNSWDHHPLNSMYDAFNKHVAIQITNFVGSMTCAWIFSVLALVSLPAVLTTAFGLTIFPHWLVAVGLIALIAWIAQTFLQLVLLSVIMVGQNVQQAASDARANKQFEDTETIVDRLDVSTQGGIEVLHKQLNKIQEHLGISHEDA